VTFTEVMEHVARAFEAVGALVLVAGLIWSLAYSAIVWRRSASGRQGYQTLRESFGGVLLLGLEILVAADLVQTVAVEPTLENVSVLGLVVVIRTVLSFSLEIEIEGVAPWRRAAMSGAGHIARSVERGRATAAGTGAGTGAGTAAGTGAGTGVAADPVSGVGGPGQVREG
jgi:uncharacterized membrane protein